MPGIIYVTDIVPRDQEFIADMPNVLARAASEHLRAAMAVSSGWDRRERAHACSTWCSAVGQYDVMDVEQEFGDRLFADIDHRNSELATGLLLGDDPDKHPAPGTCQGSSLAEALATTILPALQRPPCCVSFSGGLDSSVILATAVDLAVRHGLPLPIPITLRFPGVASAMESTWQEQVISHLRLADWVKMDFTSELDALGPIAGPALRRFGVLTPPNWYADQPMIQAAAGGSLLTGIGGDEIFCTPGELRWLVHRRPRSRLPRELRGWLFTSFPRNCNSPSGQAGAAAGMSGCSPNARTSTTVSRGRSSPRSFGLEPSTGPMVPDKAVSVPSCCPRYLGP